MTRGFRLGALALAGLLVSLAASESRGQTQNGSVTANLQKQLGGKRTENSWFVITLRYRITTGTTTLEFKRVRGSAAAAEAIVSFMSVPVNKYTETKTYQYRVFPNSDQGAAQAESYRQSLHRAAQAELERGRRNGLYR